MRRERGRERAWGETVSVVRVGGGGSYQGKEKVQQGIKSSVPFN